MSEQTLAIVRSRLQVQRRKKVDAQKVKERREREMERNGVKWKGRKMFLEKKNQEIANN